MQLRYDIEILEDYALIRTYGERNNPMELLEGTKTLYQKIQESGQKYIIADYREVNFNLDLVEAFNIVRVYDRKMPEMKGITMATVADTSIQEIADFWESVSNKKGYNFKIFYDLSEAEEWILGIIEKNRRNTSS